MTPNARSAAAIGAHTSRAGSDTSAANSSGTWPPRSPTTSTTRSWRRASAAMGADSTVTWAPENCSMSMPWAPTARTRRSAES